MNGSNLVQMMDGQSKLCSLSIRILKLYDLNNRAQN